MASLLVTQCSAVAQVENKDNGKATAAQPSVGANFDLQYYEKKIKPVLAEACFECHSGESVKGNFNVDQLDPDLTGGKDIAWWLEVYSVISNCEMPPDSDDLPEKPRALIVDWLSAEIQAAEKRRKATGSSPFRRLTRYEYNYALQDLLGVPWSFADDLPAESSEEGAFENNADSLRMSVQQVETYHRIAVKALQRITVRGEQPAEMHWSIPMQSIWEKRKKFEQKKIKEAEKKFENKPEELANELKKLKNSFRVPSADKTHHLDISTGQRAIAYWHYHHAPNTSLHSDTPSPMPKPTSHVAVVQPGNGQGLAIELDDSVPDEGTLRVRFRASRADGVVQRVPTLQLSFGFKSTDQGAALTRVSQKDLRIEASFGQPEVYQWDIPLGEIEHRNPFRGKTEPGRHPSSSEYLLFTNSAIKDDDIDSESLAVLIDYIEIAGPVYDQWPPRFHRNLFIESNNSKDKTPESESAYAKEIISQFMARAWRRSPAASEVDRKLRLFKQLRPHCKDFTGAIVEVLATVLTSPKFLYVLPGQEKARATAAPDRLSQHELATRLSLFLWCSLPDETLLKLASEGRLDDPGMLRQQAERMLADPRSARFNKHFVQQWLKMQPLEFVNPEKALDAALLEAMKEEPVALFADMLQHDSSLLEFIESDYSVINERLAKHYGVPEVRGNHFRRVALPDRLNRGGLLTLAGLLAMNSDGKDSHPVKRGVWLLTNLLNDPPPPPPAAVPEIDLTDPEILKLTLKERIENHRDHAACLSCHQKIDPWGIVFENYDALGRWRDQIDDKTVDATCTLPGNVSLDGVQGLKKHLVKDRSDQFVRATVEKMASFAVGRQLDFGDRASVTDITKRVRESGDGIKTLVLCLVTNELFRTK